MATLRQQYLQDIIDATRASSSFAVSTTRSASTPNEDIEIPLLSFSHLTSNLQLSLRGHSIPDNISDIILHRAAEISTTYQDSYRKACRRLMDISRPSSSSTASQDMMDLRNTFEHCFEQNDLPRFLSKALEAKTQMEEKNAHIRRPVFSSENIATRRPFNFDFTPYLEAYLEQNAYPSHADVNALALKGNMERAKIVNWFQNRRNRLRSADRESEIKRLPPGQTVNIAMVEAKIKVVVDSLAASDGPSNNGLPVENIVPQTPHLKLDDLATSSKDSISKTFEMKSTGPCIADSEAFGLPNPSRPRSAVTVHSSPSADDLHEVFGDINIRVAAPPIPEASKARTSKTRFTSPRASTPIAKARKSPLKAALRSCFSAAITLTCPSVHPALIRQKTSRARTPLSSSKFTILEQKYLPVQPYTLPDVLPTWEVAAIPEPEQVVRRKKPTIASHSGKTRPGSPYPKQTISRMSSASSLASMASDDSQSSSRSTSSDFSTSTVESFELDTPAQSPGLDNVELIDDVRFSDDIFGDYFFYTNPISENFFFDVNVEQPFEKDVSLSIADFDKSISLSIAEFEATTLPSFDFFES